jgi:hypothetical protein
MSETSNDNLDGGENDRLDVIRLVGPLTPATDSQTWLRDRGNVVKDSVVVRVRARRRRTRSAFAASFAAVTLVAVALVVRYTDGTVSTQNQPAVTTAGTIDPGPTTAGPTDPGPTPTIGSRPSISTPSPPQDMFGPWVRRPIEFGPLAGVQMYTPMARELFVVNDDRVSILTVATGVWRSGANPPRSLKFNALAAWTGTELLLWGSARADENSPPDDGLAYNPRTDTWRGISDAPIDLNHPQAYGYTDGELFVWGDSPREAAAYTPTTDTWRKLRSMAPAGEFGRLHASGEKSFVVVSRSARKGMTVATYDGTLDAWTESPDGVSADNMSSDVLLNGDLVVLVGEASGYDGPGNVRLWKWSSDSGWTKLASPPIGTQGFICNQSLVVIAGELVASRCGRTAYLHEGEWRPIEPSLGGYGFPIDEGTIEISDTTAAYVSAAPGYVTGKSSALPVATTADAALPLLTLTSLCYGSCGTQRPPGLAALAIYEDGTFITSSVLREVNGDQRAHLMLRSGTITNAEVTNLRAELVSIGATDGSAFSSGCGVSEGHDVLTSRAKGVASRITTWAFLDPVPCPTGPKALHDIVVAINAKPSEPYRPRWAMLAKTATNTRPGVQPTWPGPNPAELPPFGPFGERCVILDTVETPALLDHLMATPVGQLVGAPQYLVGDTTWKIWGRPLLPHEQTCADLKATAEGLPAEPWQVES